MIFLLKKRYFFVIGLSFLLGLSGCATPKRPNKTPESVWRKQPTELLQPVVNPTPVSEGGILREGGSFSLFDDRRAYQVGDVLTVVLNEQTQSGKQSGTEFTRDGELDVNIPVSLVGNNAAAAPFDLRFDNRRKFKGESSADQRNFLNGSLTVRVQQVLRNGDLVIRGEKWIRLNQGDEYIRVQGIVRPADVDPENRVSSQRIADAQIDYSGKGSLHESAQPSRISRFFNWLNIL